MTQITLSAEELKQLVQSAVRDALIEVLGDDFAPEPSFRADLRERLLRYQQTPPDVISAEDVMKELGLDG